MIPSEQYALAEAWASIDGKLAEFRNHDHPGGYREGYIADAGSMIARLKARGFQVVAI